MIAAECLCHGSGAELKFRLHDRQKKRWSLPWVVLRLPARMPALPQFGQPISITGAGVLTVLFKTRSKIVLVVLFARGSIKTIGSRRLDSVTQPLFG
jgi:hypothetical protein